MLRSLDGYCLVLDKKRIAGGKPDYRGENVLVDWTTEVAYGPVDDLAAENAKLREERDTYRDLVGLMDHPDLNVQLQAENAKLRELVRDMWHDGMCECDERGACATCEYGYLDRMRELGVEV